jgi:hypothetical protein
MADFGETVYLKLILSNLGLTDTRNLYAKISSNSDWVTIATDSVFIGTLKARSDTVLSDNLGIKISNNVPDLGIVTLKLLLKDQVSEKHYSIDICIHAPELQIINYTMDDKTVGNGDNIPDPGETFRMVFKIRNTGSSDISGQFYITSAEQNLTIVDPSVKSGLLKFGEITDIPVLVKISEAAASGSIISVSTTLNCSPYIVNKDFSFRVGKVRESFEAASFNVFPWINISPIPWTITSAGSYDGIISARSGTIGHGGTTSMFLRTLYAENDSLKFYYKVSCEPNYDFLAFKLNGKEIIRKSGEIPWTKMAIPVPAGLNKIEWDYIKDNSVSQGSDCAWIDMIDFAQSSPVNYVQKDLQVARIASPVKSDHYGQETITVKVMNLGKDTLNGFNLAYEINNRFPPVKQFFENKLFPYSDSVTVSFKTKADLSKYGNYKIVTYGVDNHDDYLFNDTLTLNIENTLITENIGVFPNPFTDKINVSVNSQTADMVQITISNLSGVRMYSVEKAVVTGNNSFTLSDFRLIPSLYYLNVRGMSVNKTIPVLKVSK